MKGSAPQQDPHDLGLRSQGSHRPSCEEGAELCSHAARPGLSRGVMRGEAFLVGTGKPWVTMMALSTFIPPDDTG